MKKKFIRVLFFGTLALSTVTYVGCKDYDDDIDNLQTQIDANKASIAELQNFVKAGKWVTNVEPVAGGFKITFNDGKSYSIINGTNGTNGANGTNGTNGAPGTKVGISADDTWVIDGIDTGKKIHGIAGDTGAQGPEGPAGPQGPAGVDGVDGKSPYIGEDHYWYFYDDAEKEYVKSEYTAETSIYVVKSVDKPNWVLHVRDDQGKWAEGVILPTAGKITSMKGVKVNLSTNKIETNAGADEINLKYGICANAISFDGVTYAKDKMLTSESLSFFALINPVNVDFSGSTGYTIRLTDSQTDLNAEDADANAVYTISKVEQFKTEKPLTRAAAEEKWNKGIYKLTVALNPMTPADLGDAAKAAYALSTLDAWGNEVISDYDIKIKNEKVTSFIDLTAPTTITTKELNKAYDLDALAAEAGINFAGVVAHYYTIDGVKATTVQAATGKKVTVKLCYLTVNGEPHDGSTQNAATKAPLSFDVTFKETVTVNLVAQTATWKTVEQPALDVTPASLTAIENAVTDAGGKTWAALEVSDFTITDAPAKFVVTKPAALAVKLNVAANFVGAKTVEMFINVSDTKVIKVLLPVTVTYPSAFSLTQSTAYWNKEGKASMAVEPVYNGGANKLESINIKREINKLYANFSDLTTDIAGNLYGAIAYTPSKEEGDNVGAVAGDVFTLDLSKTTGKNISLGMKVECAGLTGNPEVIVNKTINFMNVSEILKSEFTAPLEAKRTITNAKDKKADETDVFANFAWKDYRSEQMWPTITNATHFYPTDPTDALAIFGYGVECKLVGTDAMGYFNVTDLAKGKISLSDKAKNTPNPVNDFEITVRVTPISKWGDAPAAVDIKVIYKEWDN